MTRTSIRIYCTRGDHKDRTVRKFPAADMDPRFRNFWPIDLDGADPTVTWLQDDEPVSKPEPGARGKISLRCPECGYQVSLRVENLRRILDRLVAVEMWDLELSALAAILTSAEE